MNNNEIIIIGNVNSRKTPTGPANVIINLENQLLRSKKKFKMINSHTISTMSKLLLMIKIFLLIFTSKKIINVHSFGYKVPLLVYFVSKINKRNKYFLTLHGIVSIEEKFLGKVPSNIYSKVEEILFKKFPNIICVSNKQKKLLEEYKGENNIFLIYNGTTVEEIYIKKDIATDCIKLIMAGGIFNRKGIFEALEFINYYNKKHSKKISLDIYGLKESQIIFEKFNLKIKEYNIGKYIKYKGSIDNKDLKTKFCESDFCLIYSKFDTFNLTALESMSVGTPVIISKQAGASELIIDSKNGFRIDMDKDYIMDTSNIINYILSEKGSYKVICENCKITAKQLDWENIYLQYIKVFEN